jgi:PAS domain S-box-containing protein
MFIWWGPELIQFYNDAYSRTMGPERHPSALGQRGRKCWAEIWDIIGPQIEFVMAGKGATWQEDALVPVTRNGRREDVWWTYGYSPIDDDSKPGGVGGVLVVCNDVTAQHRALTDLKRSEHRRDNVEAELTRTTALFEAVIKMTPDLVFVKDLDSKALLRNPAALLGKNWDDIAGRKEEEWHDHPEEAAQVVANDRMVIERGESMQFVEQFTTPSGVRTLLSTKSPLFDEDKKIVGTIGVSTDITERESRARHVEFIMRELSHRSKNLLAIIQSVARQSILQSADLEDFEQHFTARLASLASLHDLLVQQEWRGAALQAIAQTQIEAFAGDRATLAGPEFFMKPDVAQVLSMVFHELSTNASKYGAFSNADGVVTVTWGVADPQSTKLFIRWQEAGGPPVRPPTRRGFGTLVLERIALQIPKAEISYEFPPDGVVWTLQAPLKPLIDSKS